MLIFKIDDEQGVELTFDGEDRKLAEQNAGNGATAQDVAFGAVVVQALKLMNYKPRMELIDNLTKAEERKDYFTKDEANWILNLLVSEYTSEPQCESIIAKCEQILERKD